VATLTIRNLDDEILAKLKERARANQRSVTAEARMILMREFDRRARMEEFRELTRRIAASTPSVPQTDSTLLIREDRDR